MSPDSIALRYTIRRDLAKAAVPTARPSAVAATAWGTLDDLANTFTHGAGLALSIAACWYLLGLVGERGLTHRTFGCAVYGIALVSLYAASTSYHGVGPSRVRDALRRLDHACIYILIGGTYTPLALGPLDGLIGWGLLLAVWGMAAAAAWGKLTAPEETLSGSYGTSIALGWLGVLVVGPLARSTAGSAVVVWLLAGGLVYTAGVFFYVRDERPLYHAVWHLFVLAGSACHFCAVWLHVVPFQD
jgi:hemolysin III